MIFQFKQFDITQLRSAMKIGTDGVLLGAWTPLENNPYEILDIGSGTGLVALMLAQRSNSRQIDAVEIDDDAFEECTENFENSPWNDRLFCFHASFQEFVTEMKGETYSLIVSNPPFYTDDFKTGNSSRNQARFENALPFNDLLNGVNQLLSGDGVFSTIIPFNEEENFTALAAQYGLFPFKKTHVKGNPDAKIKRSLIAFNKHNSTCEQNLLIIEKERHNYTDAYKNLTKAFYLKME